MELGEKIKQLDEVASKSDPTTGLDGIITVYIFNSIVEHFTGKNALELGCRGGRMTALLASVCDTLDVVEGSKIFLDRAKENVWANNVEYHFSLFESFYTSKYFTDIILVGGLDHSEVPKALLKKFSKMIDPQGAIHIIVTNAESMHRRLGVKMGILRTPSELTDRDRWHGVTRVYDSVTLRHEIEDAGLIVTHFSGIFIKPLATGQLVGLGQEVLDALYDIGKDLPQWCSYIYMRAQKMIYGGGSGE